MVVIGPFCNEVNHVRAVLLEECPCGSSRGMRSAPSRVSAAHMHTGSGRVRASAHAYVGIYTYIHTCIDALARAPARIGLSACAVQRSRAHALRPALAVAAWARDINEYPCLACPVLHLAVSTHLVVEAADSPSKSTLPPLPFKCEPIITTAVAAVPTAGSLAAHQHPASCAAVSRLCTMA